MQVYHRFQELEEEDRGREEVQEIERTSQGREETHMKITMSGDRDSNVLSRSACADDVNLKNKRDEIMRADHARSVEVVSGVRIVQFHAIIDVFIDVRIMQCHQAIDSSGFSISCPNSHLVVMLY